MDVDWKSSAAKLALWRQSHPARRLVVTGFVARDNAFYKPIRDAGLATGTLQPK